MASQYSNLQSWLLLGYYWTIFNPWTPAFVFWCFLPVNVHSWCLWMPKMYHVPCQATRSTTATSTVPICEASPVRHFAWTPWIFISMSPFTFVANAGRLRGFMPMIRPFLINACSHATSAGLTAWKSRCLQRGRQCRRHQVARIRQNRSRNRRRRWLKMNKLISMSGREGKILGNSTVLCLGARCFYMFLWMCVMDV